MIFTEKIPLYDKRLPLIALYREIPETFDFMAMHLPAVVYG